VAEDCLEDAKDCSERDTHLTPAGAVQLSLCILRVVVPRIGSVSLAWQKMDLRALEIAVQAAPKVAFESGFAAVPGSVSRLSRGR
jgi:hypothetical protein